MKSVFDQIYAHEYLEEMSEADLDNLGFGVIGFDDDSIVCRYNRFESRSSKIDPEKVLGQPLFTLVAPCMNNYLVAQRFEDAKSEGVTLDATIDYTFTWRMRPTKVELRLLCSPEFPRNYVLVRY